jgi:hypothetical protein
VQVLLTSDEYNECYHAVSEKLLGSHLRYPRSFVAHCMVMQKGYLTSLTQRIEQVHRKPWQHAIIDNLNKSGHAGFSEYELYGNYLTHFHKDCFEIRYWFNRKADMSDSKKFEAVVREYARFTFLSNHIKHY